MKQKILFFFIFLTFHLYCQNNYSKEFSIQTDNDLYTSITQDRYYTNGISFKYNYITKKKSSEIIKNIISFELGHHMYTPYVATVKIPEDHDRPFAAYLFGAMSYNLFYKNESILKASFQIGTIGPNALGKEIQDFVHDIYGFEKAIGWRYQIENAFALNLNFDYIKKLKFNNYIDINWVNNVKLGTVHTDISTGFYGRIGIKPLQKIINSIAFNGNLNDSKSGFQNKSEAFIYIKPMIHYIAYDATIEGGFLNNNSPITFNIEPIKFTSEIGIRFTANRFNFGYTVNYHTKKLKSIRVPKRNFYGTIQVNYQFN